MMNCDFCRSCEESIRRSPLGAVGIATVGGLVLSRLPLAAVVGALIRLAVALVRPALVIFGIWKLIEYTRKSSGAAEPGPQSPL